MYRSGLSAVTAMTLIAAAFAPGPVRAQTPSLMNPGPVVGTARTAPPPAPPPPGLPGAATTTGAPAPPPSTESGLSPTDALFDAINRGDLTAARAAIGRGAQLDAKNLLGMTPLELSVDLNRNDIAFLLLSIEHEGGAAASSAGASTALSIPPAPAATPAAVNAAKAPARGGEATGSVASLLLAGQPAPAVPSSRAVAPHEPVQAALPPLGGGPNPAVGFLGFGPTQEAAAQN